MAKNVLCLTSEFIDIDYLKSVFTCRPMLKNYLQNICDSSLACHNVQNQEYMGYNIPLKKIEDGLYLDNTDIVVISKDLYNLKFLRLEEHLMNIYPKLSFFLRNASIEKQGSDQLLSSKAQGNILFVSLYNNLKDSTTIKIK